MLNPEISHAVILNEVKDPCILSSVEHLASITGSQYVREHGDSIAVSPANTQQVSEVLRYADENGITVTPAGGSTKQFWGNPTTTDLRLDLTRLNRVLEHPWQDLTCTVEAGCTWQYLQQTLARHGQFVALDPLWPARATVGGILATNDSGALRHRYGSLRDLVIGMTLVLADGTVARSGGKVVKNVAGYDLCKLVTGSFGTLAIITEATFRLHPLPRHTETFTASASQAAELAPLMASIRASHLLTEALQLRGDATGFHLDIQLNAHPDAKQAGRLTEIAQQFGSFSFGDASDEVWRARESLFMSKDALLLKIGTLPADTAEVADDIVRLGGSVVAQAIGILYAAFPHPDREHSILGGVHASTRTGFVSVLQTPSTAPDAAVPPPGAKDPGALMKAVKHRFDPNRTLNPGKLSGIV